MRFHLPRRPNITILQDEDAYPTIFAIQLTYKLQSVEPLEKLKEE